MCCSQPPPGGAGRTASSDVATAGLIRPTPNRSIGLLNRPFLSPSSATNVRDVHASSVQLDFDALYAQSPMPKSLHSSLPEAPAPATPEMPSNSCTFDAATTGPDNQSITLRNWYLQHAVKNEVSTGSVSAERGSLCIAVEGTVVHATRPSAGVLWHSSAIEERLADGTVRSFTGSTYRFCLPSRPAAHAQ